MHDYTIVERGAPLQSAQKAIILIHGRGAGAEDILSLEPFFSGEHTYIVAPEANNCTWYPYSFMIATEQNQPWLNSAIQTIEVLIQNIERHVPVQNIFIMGFSQGACLASEVACRNARRYGGIAVFTGGLIGQQINTTNYKGNFEQTPVYLSNGDHDPHIPLGRTEETYDIMNRMGADIRKEIFPGRTHTINEQEIEHVKEIFNL
jgi:phospholipase/carboxylesterase